MKLIDQLPVIQREKRFIPALVTGLALIGLVAGPAVKTYRLAQSNANGIDQIANLTDMHSNILRDSAVLLEQYKKSIVGLHMWAEEIEERLDEDPITSQSHSDVFSRGRRAGFVKAYMQWFEAQEKLLMDINLAATRKKIPHSLGSMLNLTSNFGVIANLSTLYDCSYRLENKNMILDLDFLLPTIDEDVEILAVASTDVYAFLNHTDEKGEEVCWETYVGPKFVIHNKTNGCTKALNKNKLDLLGVRGQTCLEQTNELYYPKNRTELWLQDGCAKEAPKIPERIQITEIDGAHKIYCHPFAIEIDDIQQPCPNSSFILEGHANYKIENITHDGAFIDTSISRYIETPSTRSVLGVRSKRSAIPPAAVTNPSSTTTTKPTTIETRTSPPKVKISDTLRNLTGQMNTTLAKIRESISRLPDRLNITRENFDTILDYPLEFLGDSFRSISENLRSLGSFMGLLALCMFLVLIMPVLEMMIIGFKIVKIPANLWLASAKRVTSNLKHASNTGLSSLTRSKRRHWTETAKGV